MTEQLYPERYLLKVKANEIESFCCFKIDSSWIFFKFFFSAEELDRHGVCWCLFFSLEQNKTKKPKRNGGVKTNVK